MKGFFVKKIFKKTLPKNLFPKKLFPKISSPKNPSPKNPMERPERDVPLGASGGRRGRGVLDISEREKIFSKKVRKCF
jgi:hypothetical protein